LSGSRARAARESASRAPEHSLAAPPPAASGKRKRRLFHALRVAITAALLWLVLRKASVGDVLSAIAGTLVHWPFLLLALVTPGLNIVIQAVRWRLLLSGRGEERPLGTLTAAILVGVFYNQFLPSTIGGDVARSWWISRPPGGGGMPALWPNLAVVALDRAIALAAMCAMGVAAAAAVPAIIREMPQFWPVAGAVAGAMAVAALLALDPRAVAAARRLPLPPLLGGLRRKAGLIHGTLIGYRNRKGLLAAAFGLSVLFQGVLILHYLVLAGALGLEVDRLSLAVTVPIVSMVAVMPITVNGLGLREGTLAVLGAPIGLAASEAVALAWLFVFTSLAYALAGGIIQMASGSPLPARAQEGSGATPSPDPGSGIPDEAASG
jgi:uncharacterized membrane protein YbhN (UPF0104 family)